LLFKTDNTQGVICFWKGNGGTLKTWGVMAPQFLKCKYDIIITDYREHGKSTGEITIENFYSDSQLVYDFLKTRYSENQIVNKNDSFFEIQGADHGSILRTRDLEKILCDLLTHDEARR